MRGRIEKNKSVANLAFGIAIRQIRHSQKLTQDELAYRANLDRTYISLLELGANSPSLDTIFLLCAALDVKFSTLARLIEEALAEQNLASK